MNGGSLLGIRCSREKIITMRFSTPRKFKEGISAK